ERIAAGFRHLLEQLSGSAERRLAELSLLAASERDWLVNEWNATARPYPASATLPQLFETQVAATPDATAVVTATETLSYAELNRRANRLAHYLIAAGVGPDLPVGVYMERSIDLVVALYAIIKAGGAYVPLDPDYPQQRLAQMLADAQVNWVLTHAAVAAELPGTSAAVLSLEAIAGELATLPAGNPAARAQPESLAYIIFTSGSTGRPKGVMNEHRGICNRLLWMQEAFGLGPADRVLHKTPFSFDVSVWELFWPLQTGASLVLAKPGGHRDTGYLCELIAAQQISTIHFVPSMLAVFLDDPHVVRANVLRRIICSGETLTTDLQSRALNTLDAHLFNLYGPTEAAVDVTFWRCRPEPGVTRVPIGHPVANTRIYIVTPDGALAAPGAPGELWIGGVQVARGYINQPELSAERFTADPFAEEPEARVYRTGDIARLRDDGALEFLGRSDDQVKLRGYRIEPGEIETVFVAQSGVSRCAVMLREDTPGDQRLVAYVCATAAVSSDDLLAAARERLPAFMVPAAVVLLEQLPLTPSGKLDRARLPAPEWRQAGTAAAEPRNPVEATLAEIWADTLQLDQVGIHDDFFALGGHSLIAMQLVSRIMARLQVQLPLDALFNTPTVAGLAAAISTAGNDPRPAPDSRPISRTARRDRRRRK
ncbi:MAG: amino acid adenylation domain-containing protein, partial [Gammaproteobacteria bacterium]|nr:amino acid adenylation domain-containing protein [Gammaproteobacteria bacterium]